MDLKDAGEGDIKIYASGSMPSGTKTTPVSLSIKKDTLMSTATISTTSTVFNVSPVAMQITFSKEVTGLILSKFTTNNVSLGNLSGSGKSYTFNASPNSNGSFSISLSTGAVFDVAGNPNVASSTFTQTFNSASPTVVISSTAGTFTNVSPIPVTVTFSAAVTGFNTSKMTLVNGSASGFAGSGTTYTFNLTPTGQGVVSVDIAAAAVNDAGGNPNIAAAQFTRTYDTVQPGTTISSTSMSTTNLSLIPVTVTFSESVTGFTSAGVVVTNGTVSGFAGSGSIYTFNVAPTAQGAVTVNVSASTAQDAAGNNNTVATQLARTYDSIAPTVAITSTSSSPTNVSPIPVTVTFSESVTGFTSGKVTLGNGVISGFAGSGTTYTFNVTPSGQGAVTIDVASSGGQDLAGNNSAAASQLSVTYDSAPPTITFSGVPADPSNTTSLNIAVSSSGADAISYKYKVGLAASVDCTSATGYSVPTAIAAAITNDISAVADGLIKLCGVGLDPAGNWQSYASSTSVTWTKDTTPPVFTSIDLINDAVDTYISASEHSGSSLALAGNLVGTGYTTASYGLVTSATTCNGSVTYGAVIPASNSASFTSDGTYKVCVKLVDSSNNSSYGASSTFTYDSAGPAVGGSGVISSASVGDTSLTLNWTKSTDTSTAQANLQYLVYQSTSNNLGTVANIEANGTALGSYVADINTKSVSGLSILTPYYFNIIVKDQSGNKSAYSTISATTTGDVTPPTPGNTGSLSVSNVLDTTATVTWTAATDVVTSAANLQYLVYWSTNSSMNTVSNIKANGTAVGSYTANITTLNLTGLTPSKTLYFNVLVKDLAGNEAAYSQASATTINYLWIGGTAATLEWNSIGANGITLSYDGSASLNYPEKMTSDATYLYVTDSQNYRIARYILSTGAFAGWIGIIGTLPVNDASCPNPVVGALTPGWCKGGTPVSGSYTNGFFFPSGIVLDNSGNLYVSDAMKGIVLKFNASTGAWVGWIGQVFGTTTCAKNAQNFTSAGWCNHATNSTFASSSTSATGGMGSPRAIATDNTYLYVADLSLSRVDRYNMDGTFAGWIGWIDNSLPTNNGSCPSPAVNQFTPGWCTGGKSKSSSANGGHSPFAIVISGSNLFVADVGNSKSRISKYDKATGAFLGWIGSVGTSPTGGAAGCNGAAVGTITPGFCTGGTAASITNLTSEGLNFRRVSL